MNMSDIDLYILGGGPAGMASAYYAHKSNVSYSLFEGSSKIGGNCKTIEITGGEPLVQDSSIVLMKRLVAQGYEVLLETSGSFCISKVPKEVHIIMDLKCPDSNMSSKNHYPNLSVLTDKDNLKFVVASKRDFIWAVEKIEEFQLEKRTKILFSPAWGLVKPENLVEWILESKISCRLNLQIHKYIWHPRTKGV